MPGLGDEETISGGNKFIFLSSYLFKLTAGKEFKDDKDLGIQGRVVNCRILKSRSGYNATSLPLVYHARYGFHNEWTSFWWIKENDLLKGGGRAGFSIPNFDAAKFAQKDFLKTYNANAKFKDAFDTLIDEKFSAIIDNKLGDAVPTETSSEGMTDEFED